MSEQLQHGDLRIVKESDNRYHVHEYRKELRGWGHHRIFDQEGIVNFTDVDDL